MVIIFHRNAKLTVDTFPAAEKKLTGGVWKLSDF